MTEIKSIKQALLWAAQCLEQAEGSPRFEAEILLAHLLKKPRAYLYTHDEQMLAKFQWEGFQALIKKRAQGRPIAYLKQEKEFWSLPFIVNEDSLIPRPETELLVELSLDLIGPKKEAMILDLGTGSGAIALALAKERPNWQIIAVDRSKRALKLAQRNAEQLNLPQVSFFHSYWFRQLPANLRFDLILSNPPYLAADDPHLFQEEIRFEPRRALVAAAEGLADLHYIIKHAQIHLKPQSWLLLEHGWKQREAVLSLFKKYAYVDCQSYQDIQKQDRVCLGRKE